MSKRTHEDGSDAEPESEAKRTTLSVDAIARARRKINTVLGDKNHTLDQIRAVLHRQEIDTVLNATNHDMNGGLCINYPPLFFAAMRVRRDDDHDHVCQVMALLIDAGADIGVTIDGHGILHALAQHGKLPQIHAAKFLIDRGIDIKARTANRNYTPLHMASIFSHVALVRMLLERGADPNAVTRDAEPPIMLVARYNEIDGLDTVLALAEWGADVNAEMPRFNGDSARHIVWRVCTGYGPVCNRVLWALFTAGARVPEPCGEDVDDDRIEQIVGQLGGPDGVARAHREWIESLPETSVARQRWLEAQPGRRTKAAGKR